MRRYTKKTLGEPKFIAVTTGVTASISRALLHKFSEKCKQEKKTQSCVIRELIEKWIEA
jgi:hypothetical protein